MKCPDCTDGWQRLPFPVLTIHPTRGTPVVTQRVLCETCDGSTIVSCCDTAGSGDRASPQTVDGYRPRKNNTDESKTTNSSPTGSAGE